MHTMMARGNPVRPQGARVVLFLLLSCAILSIPSDPAALSVAAFARLPLEPVLAAAVLLLVPHRLFGLLRIAVTTSVLAVLFLKLADFGTGTAFQRPFNPYLDIKMMADGWNLLSRTIGMALAMLAVLALVSFLTGAALLLYWTAGGFRARSGHVRRLGLVGAGIVLAVGWGAMASCRAGQRVTADAVGYLSGRVALMARSIADMRDFETVLALDPQAQSSPDSRFSLLRGKDVVVIFIESYGRSAIADPLYAPKVTDRLGRMETAIEAAGLSSASAWLQSPTVGGLSWLAHGTFLSGLWIDNQARYDRLVASNRISLNALFAQAGWRTTAIMPAITMAWPEARWFGYDTIHAAADLGYRGKPFNWVTMPDQFTLEAFERLERRPEQRHRPVMAEIALISSHAPWTPVPMLIDWDRIGDGTVFNAQATSGDPPATVWADPERVRNQYLKSIDYTLETLGSYMVRYGKTTVFILLGDHQPAAIVTGPNATRAVPVHIVSDDRRVLTALDKRTWSPGLLPPAAAPVIGMDRMRDMFLDSFGERP